MIGRCSPETLYTRFRSVFREVTHDMALRYCCGDYDREMGLVAEVQHGPLAAAGSRRFRDRGRRRRRSRSLSRKSVTSIKRAAVELERILSSPAGNLLSKLIDTLFRREVRTMRQLVTGGMMGGGMDGGKTGTAAAPTVTVAPDGSVLILRGSTLFKYDSDLNLRAQAELPAPSAHEHH